VVSGVGTLVGLASGVILGALIMYYLLKDGTTFRRSVERFDPAFQTGIDSFLGDSFRTRVTTGELEPSCRPSWP
jgi:predicted PurR-regulated permease PerM